MGSSKTTRFGMNLKDADGNFMYRLAFRQAIDNTGSGPILVQNSREGEGLLKTWGSEIRATWPAALEEGAEFTITIECQEDKFVGYLNGEAMAGVEFPTDTLWLTWPLFSCGEELRRR